MTVRPFKREDREEAAALLGDARAIDSSGHRLHVLSEGGIQGVSLWFSTGEGSVPVLAGISLANPGRRDMLYRLAAAACQDAIDQGLSRGCFNVRSRALLRQLRRDFAIDPRPSGWDPTSGEAIEWEIEVDLEDARAQLGKVIGDA